MTTLIGLHGFTQHGAQLRAQLAPLLARLPPQLDVEFPDGPHPCSAQGVERLRRLLGGTSLPPPHLAWWDATDDGRQYRGWEVSLARLRELAERAPFGLLGFSQGAMVAAALSGLAARAEFPSPRFVVMVAGRKPRADALQHLFAQPIALPSLHVWGDLDALSQESSRLTQAFAASLREELNWPGPHVVPTHGQGADAIVDFIARHASP